MVALPLVVGLLVVVVFLLLVAVLANILLVMRRLVVVTQLATFLLVASLGGPGGPGRGDAYQTANVPRQGHHYVLEEGQWRPGFGALVTCCCSGLKVATHDAGLAFC